MKFKIDENLPQAAAELLQSAGFETQTVRDEGLAGKPDEVIAAAVRAEDRVLVMLDRGFRLPERSRLWSPIESAFTVAK